MSKIPPAPGTQEALLLDLLAKGPIHMTHPRLTNFTVDQIYRMVQRLRAKGHTIALMHKVITLNK